MTDIHLNRRTFVKGLALSLLQGQLLMASPAHAELSEKLNKQGIRFIEEASVVYKKWLTKETIAPEAYYKSRMAHYKLSATEFSKLVEIDFIQENLFEVNGLVLSKTEAALIARMGEILKVEL